MFQQSLRWPRLQATPIDTSIIAGSRARSGAPLVIKIHLPPIHERAPPLHPRPFVLIIAVESAVLNVVSDEEEEGADDPGGRWSVVGARMHGGPTMTGAPVDD